MNKLCCFVLFLSLALSSVSSHSAARDKELHFAASGGLSTLMYSSLRNEHKMNRKRAYIYAVAFGLAVGALKEMNDQRFDWQDMKYNLLGSATVPLLIIYF